MAAEVKFGINADAAKTVAEWKKVAAAQGKVIEQQRGMKRELRKAGTEAEKTQGTLAGFGKSVGGMVSVATAIAGITRAMGAMNAEANRGADALDDKFAGLKQLSQVAKSQEDFAALQGRVSKWRSTGMSFDASQKLVFATRSAQRDEEEPFFGSLSKFTSPYDMFKGANTLRKAFGREELGSAQQATNKLIAGGGISDITPEEFAGRVVPAASAWATNKWRDETLMGAFSVLSDAMGGAERTATGLVAFATVAGKEFPNAGGSMAGALEQFQKMPPSKLKKLIDAEKRFKAGYSAINMNLPAINAATAQIDEAQALTGTAQSQVAQRLGIATGDPVLAELQRGAESRESREMGEEGMLGLLARQRRAAYDRVVGESLARGEDPVTRTARKAIMHTVGAFGAVFGYGGAPVEDAGRDPLASFRQMGISPADIIGALRENTDALNRRADVSPQ